MASQSIKDQEDACVLPAFDADVAWELGTLIRNAARRGNDHPAVVSITHANSSQLLFFAASKPGLSPDIMQLVKRKEASVRRWGMSTVRLRMELRQRGFHPSPTALRDAYEVADPDVYTCHGGGFLVRVKNVEGVVGMIVVSGWHQGQGSDHGIIVESIQKYLAERSESGKARTGG